MLALFGIRTERIYHMIDILTDLNHTNSFKESEVNSNLFEIMSHGVSNTVMTFIK